MAELPLLQFRKPEPSDVDALYRQKNDPLVISSLGGFSRGYARRDIDDWIERMRTAKSDAVYVISEEGGSCIGHLGLYDIDHRTRSAEFGIMIGDPAWWGRGIGTRCVEWSLRYGFDELALHRIHLSVLVDNHRALRLYERCGF
ncbi:MAG TPA: GNAT family N-acetyltransferase, partial [Mycobacterium sp.]